MFTDVQKAGVDQDIRMKLHVVFAHLCIALSTNTFPSIVSCMSVEHM